MRQPANCSPGRSSGTPSHCDAAPAITLERGQWRLSRSTLPSMSGAPPWCSSPASRPTPRRELFGKLEMLNPGGSVKDRIGVAMLDAAEREGVIEPGRTTVVEATSGNTGIALAFVCAARGYELILTLPQGMSREREGLLRLYGAQVRVTESMGGMNEAVAAAQELAREDGFWLPDQFSNPANPEAHRATTGPEIWDALDGQRRLPGLGRRHRRHDHRRGRLSEGAQPELPRRGGRAGHLGRAVRRAPRAAQDPGHRRRLRPAGARPRPARRGHRRRRRGRDRDRAPGRAQRGRAVRASRPGRRCGRRCRSPRARRRGAGGSR